MANDITIFDMTIRLLAGAVTTITLAIVIVLGYFERLAEKDDD